MMFTYHSVKIHLLKETQRPENIWDVGRYVRAYDNKMNQNVSKLLVLTARLRIINLKGNGLNVDTGNDK